MIVARRQEARPKHRPQRSCVVCRRRQDKRSLTRLVRRDGSLLVDPGGKAEGRGAYLCDSPACRESAALGPALERALTLRLTDAARRQLLRDLP